MYLDRTEVRGLPNELYDEPNPDCPAKITEEPFETIEDVLRDIPQVAGYDAEASDPKLVHHWLKKSSQPSTALRNIGG